MSTEVKESEDSVQLHLHCSLISLCHTRDTRQHSPAVCGRASASNCGSVGLQWLRQDKVKRGEALVSQASASLLRGEYFGLRAGLSLQTSPIREAVKGRKCALVQISATASWCIRRQRKTNGSHSRGWKEPTVLLKQPGRLSELVVSKERTNSVGLTLTSSCRSQRRRHNESPDWFQKDQIDCMILLWDSKIAGSDSTKWFGQNKVYNLTIIGFWFTWALFHQWIWLFFFYFISYYLASAANLECCNLKKVSTLFKVPSRVSAGTFWLTQTLKIQTIITAL